MGYYYYPHLQTEELEQRTSSALPHRWNVELKSARVEPPRFALYHNYSVFHHFLGSPGPQPRPLPGPTPTSGMTARRRVAWLWVCSCPSPAAALKGSTSSSHPTPTMSLQHCHKHTRTQGHTERVRGLLRHRLWELQSFLAAIPTASLSALPPQRTLGLAGISFN